MGSRKRDKKTCQICGVTKPLSAFIRRTCYKCIECTEHGKIKVDTDYLNKKSDMDERNSVAQMFRMTQEEN